MKIKERILNRIKEDYGFSGTTHSLSAVAIFLLLAAFFSNFFFGKFLKTENTIVFITSLFIVAGAALIPDLDNTQSTAKSSLGVLGNLMSTLMRNISTVIFNLTKTKYDKDDNGKFAGKSNPHRQFWHTFISAIVMGVIVYFTSSIRKEIYFSLIDKKISIGLLFTGLWLYISLKLSFAGLFNKRYKKIDRTSKKYKQIIFNLLCIIFPIIVIIFAPKDISYYWVAYSFAFGIFIHILGDTFTIAGAPILWPLKHKGKRWWNYKIIGIKSNGDIEKYVFVPIFIIIILASLIKIVLTVSGV